MKSSQTVVVIGITITSLVAPGLARAGSQDVSCVSLKKNVSFTTESAEVSFTDGRKGTQPMKRPMVLQPEFPASAPANDKNVLIVPTSNRKIVSKNNRHIHIVHKDGSDCDGRELWDTAFRQSFIFMAHDGGNLSGEFQTEFKRTDVIVEGQTEDGYVVVEMLCRDWGVTSPGGCRAEDDSDVVTEVKDK